VTNLSRSTWSVANLRNPGRMIGQLCVNKYGGFSTLSLSEESTCRSVWAFCSVKTRKGLENVCFVACFLQGLKRCRKEYDRLRGLCIGQVSDFLRVSGLLQQLLARLLRRHVCFLICCEAAFRWQPITSIEFKLVARQVEASVVIRATQLKFVAESRAQVYFSQHVASTCNTIFCCETSWSRTR